MNLSWVEKWKYKMSYIGKFWLLYILAFMVCSSYGIYKYVGFYLNY